MNDTMLLDLSAGYVAEEIDPTLDIVEEIERLKKEKQKRVN